MFDRTKNIFASWWKQILGLSLQPMILFAYLGVFIAVFDNAIVGDATFDGDGKNAPKRIMCHNSSVGDILITDPYVNATGGEVDDNSNNTSIYCIFRFAAIDTLHGLETLGIALPVLASMTQEKMATITKAALLMFIFLQFLDKISGFATDLVGGAELKSNLASAAKMTGAAFAALRGVSERGRRAITKHGGAVARGGASMVTSNINSIGKLGSGSKSGGSYDQGVDQSRSSKAGDASTGSKKSGDSARSSSTAMADQGASSSPKATGDQGASSSPKATGDQGASSSSKATGDQAVKTSDSSGGDNSSSSQPSQGGDGSGKA